MNHRLRIVTKRIAGYTAHFFRYEATKDMGFNCSLLCEVGQPFIPGFERMIKARKLDLVVVNIPERPWLITVPRHQLAVAAEKNGTGVDICSVCSRTFPPGELRDITEADFDLICPECEEKKNRKPKSGGAA
jgi:hypothetical protein